MAATVSLAQMVDLALGSPEVGAVNFNVLHTLLHALLQKLNLAGLKADINESDREFLAGRTGDMNTEAKDGSDNSSVTDTKSIKSAGSGNDSGIAGSIPQTHVPYHKLIDRVSKLEQQLDMMNSLPSNNEMFERLKSKGEGERPRPMADMWQGMQLTRRVDANEEGIGKLMSMFEDMMTDMQALKDATESLKRQLDEMGNVDGKFEDLLERLKALENMTNDLNNRFSQYPDLEEFENYVTWPGLEDALKGIRDSMEYKPPERIVIEMNTQTDRPETPPKAPTPAPRPVSAVSSIRPSSGRSRTSTPGPTLELSDILEKLGGLYNRHDVLEERVTVVEDELKNKADKSDLIGLGSGGSVDVPSDLLEQLKDLQEQMARLQKNRDKKPTAPVTRSVADTENTGKRGSADNGQILEKLTSLEKGQKRLEQGQGDLQASVSDLDRFTCSLEKDLRALEAQMAAWLVSDSQTAGYDSDLKHSIVHLQSNLHDVDVRLQALQVMVMTTPVETQPLNPQEYDAALYADRGSELRDSGIQDGSLLSTSNDSERFSPEAQGTLLVSSGHIAETKPTTSPCAQVEKIKTPPPCSLEKDGTPGTEESVSFQMKRDKSSSLISSEIDQLKLSQSNEPDKKADKRLSDQTNLSVRSEEHISMSEKDRKAAVKRLSDVDISEKALTQLEGFQNKLKWLTQDTNLQMSGVKERLNHVENELERLGRLSARRESAASLRSASSTHTPRDSDALSRMQQVILQLQAEVDRISNTAQNLIEDSANKQKNIDALFGVTSNLDERKADKEFVHMEVDVKADKRHLDNKVNRSVFDTACEELNRMIKELLDKLFGHEDEWKKALGTLSTDIDGKLDRLEFKPIRDDIERQLKAISKKINNLDIMGDLGDDDAAGIRKQLLQRFHCISCDRPVDMMPQGPIPSIPASAGLPATRSTRPYTTFELDQIRQTARSATGDRKPVDVSGIPGRNTYQFERALFERQIARCRMHDCKLLMSFNGELPPLPPRRNKLELSTQPNLEVTDMYATTRSCGGPHTMTFPHRRITRMTHINNLFRDDVETIPIAPSPPYKEELDIQGADGHIYRGRTMDSRLPLIQSTGPAGGQQTASPNMMRRAQTSPGSARPTTAQTACTTARSGRPVSARHLRPMSDQVNARPHSALTSPSKDAMSPTEVPTGRDSIPPPPSPPAPSERDTRDARTPSVHTPTLPPEEEVAS